MTSLCAPFVFDLFDRCLSHIDTNVKMLAAQGPLTEENIIEIAGLRGHVVAPLTFLIMAHTLPEVITGVFGREDAIAQQTGELRVYTSNLANRISDMIGRDEPAGLNAPRHQDGIDPYKSFTLMTLDIAQQMIDLCKKEIEAEGDITNNAKIVRVHGANCVLSSTLVCVMNVITAPKMLQSIGYDAEVLRATYLNANQYVSNTRDRLLALNPKP